MSDGERRLAAIMFTDVVGYTSLSQKNEALAMELLEEHRGLVRPFFSKHNGREVKTIGDAFLVEFASALEAVRCAFDIQQSLHEMDSGRPFEKQIQLRIGVHVGDVIHSKKDVYGDAVNVASRIEPLAAPGGICVSGQVYEHVRNKFEFPITSIGRKDLKNVSEPTEVFRVQLPWERDAESRSDLDSHRIAVLPFANMSPDPGDEYFADGMTEELITSLSGVGGLTVIARTSVMKYKTGTKGVDEIGRELKVGSVVEGSVRKAGNRIRVTVQLVNSTNEGHLWAQNYDRNLDDVFAVQSDVAKQVADALSVRILRPELERIEKKPTENIDAYTLYLKGRYFWNKRGLEDMKKAVEFLEQAIREDPSFALGYVGLADSLIVLRTNWYVDLDPGHEKAKSLLARAMELDPSLSEAYATMGLLLSNDYHPKEAEKKFRKAIELKPSYVFAHMWYYLLLGYEQRWDEALDQIEKAMELDPLSPVINFNYAYFFLAKREYRKALELFKRVAELDPSFGSASWMAVMCGKLQLFDDMDRNFETFAKLLQGSYPLVRKGTQVWAAYLRNDKETVKRLLPQLEDRVKETLINCTWIAGFYFYLGEVDKGFEWLERSYSRKEHVLLGIKSDDFFDGIRSDPRYLNLLKRMGLA